MSASMSDGLCTTVAGSPEIAKTAFASPAVGAAKSSRAVCRVAATTPRLLHPIVTYRAPNGRGGLRRYQQIRALYPPPGLGECPPGAAWLRGLLCRGFGPLTRS